MSNTSKHAAALGRMAAGKPKRLSPEVREAKRERMREINRKRTETERRLIAAKNLAHDAIDYICIKGDAEASDRFRKRLEQL